MSGERVLIVGSYPPIPGAASQAALAAVRRAWDDGDEVTVVSPRPSAAHLAVPVVGLLAGRRLAHVRQLTGAHRLVLCAEAGMPLPLDGPVPAWRQNQGAARLVAAMREFRHTTLVLTGDLLVGDRPVAVLRAAADEVLLPTPAAGAPADGITSLGPPELRLRDWPRRLTGIAARTVLGHHAGAVRLRVVKVLQVARGHAGPAPGDPPGPVGQKRNPQPRRTR